jgi:exonuclease VII large subunit
MLVAAVLYTMLVVCLNIIARGGGSNLFEPDELSTFSAEEIKERIYGSKIVVVSEQVRHTK